MPKLTAKSVQALKGKGRYGEACSGISSINRGLN
jgi:hypothetical protein